MSESMNRTQRREAKRHMAKTSAQFPLHLVEIPRSEFPVAPPPNLITVWRSRDYLVQVFKASEPCAARLSVNRTEINSGGWKADIPWQDLQRLKSECGYGEFDAVEVYPCDSDVVNVANMRHLFVMAGPLSFAWRRA